MKARPNGFDEAVWRAERRLLHSIARTGHLKPVFRSASLRRHC
jgi:hypothetical protein